MRSRRSPSRRRSAALATVCWARDSALLCSAKVRGRAGREACPLFRALSEEGMPSSSPLKWNHLLYTSRVFSHTEAPRTPRGKTGHTCAHAGPAERGHGGYFRSSSCKAFHGAGSESGQDGLAGPLGPLGNVQGRWPCPGVCPRQGWRPCVPRHLDARGGLGLRSCSGRRRSRTLAGEEQGSPGPLPSPNDFRALSRVRPQWCRFPMQRTRGWLPRPVSPWGSHWRSISDALLSGPGLTPLCYQ